MFEEIRKKIADLAPATAVYAVFTPNNDQTSVEFHHAKYLGFHDATGAITVTTDGFTRFMDWRNFAGIEVLEVSDPIEVLEKRFPQMPLSAEARGQITAAFAADAA